jgi:DNA-binding response OmpR family regulator
VETAPGQGTTFKVYLPMVDAAPSPRVSPAPVGGSLRGQETVLICEDEAMILRLAGQIVSNHGYTVLCADNPRQAIKLAAASDEPIHLLVTDAIMPDMSGVRLAEILSQEHPEMRVLFMSGYTADVLADYGLATESLELLEKPFTPAGLLGRIRTLLDRPLSTDTAEPPPRPVRVPPSQKPLCVA